MLTIYFFPLGPLDTNSYIVHNDKEAVLVDVGQHPAPIMRYLEKKSLNVNAIYLTHLHFDHIYGLSFFLKTYPVPVYAHPEDVFLLTSTRVKPENYGLSPLETDFTIHDLYEGTFSLLGVPCKALHTPGHSPGSISYYLEEIHSVIVGDVLFYHTIGRTDFPGGDYDTLANSIRTKLYSLPDETIVYPGHGQPTSIGHEKRHNPCVQELL
ncbi:MAG: MBL fold metallo-hydrolase [Desulfovibrionaceae bacterium]